MIVRKLALWPVLLFAAFAAGCAHRLRPQTVVVAVPPHVYQEPTFDQVVAEGADGSVQQAKKKYGIDLDYGSASVKKVDTILTKLHAEYVKDKSNQRWTMEGLGWGAYVGEVIRRQYGGHWEKQDAATGNPLPLVWRNGTSFPVTWSLQQIVNGETDGIWARYQEITSPEYTRAIAAVKKT